MVYYFLIILFVVMAALGVAVISMSRSLRRLTAENAELRSRLAEQDSEQAAAALAEQQQEPAIPPSDDGTAVEAPGEEDDTEEEAEENAAEEAEEPEEPMPARPVLTLEEKAWLARCQAIVDDNMQNENFTVETLADILTMSHSALYKRIRALTGMSPIKFITDYRISKAIKLFDDGYTNVNIVSEIVGFRDPRAFRQMFRRAKGIPPKAYILSLKRNP